MDKIPKMGGDASVKAIVLLSGGIDSTTCLALAVEKFGADEVLALSARYGQKHDKELRAAQNVAAYYGINHQILDLAELFKGSDSSLLSGTNKKIPHESYSDQIKKTGGAPVSTYVPFRNGLFLASAASIAISQGCTVIYYGAHADDAAGNAYPDCSEEFNSAMSRAIFLGSGNKLIVSAPFISMNKTQVVKKGLSLGAPYELTWSCYEGGDKPCGKCGTCIDRANAFDKNGVKDPAIKN